MTRRSSSTTRTAARMRLQPSFRLTLSAVIVGLVVLAVLAVGVVSFRFGRDNATELSRQVLDQTLHRIDLHIQSFLRVAARQSGLSARLLESGRLSGRPGAAVEGPTAEDFPGITTHFAQTMGVQGTLTNVGLGLEDTGEFCMVARRPDRLVSFDYVRQADGTIRVDTFEAGDASRRPTGPKEYDGYDPRKRPFYRRAVAAGGPAWTEAYLFFGAGGRERLPGVTYATPIRRASGDRAGVMHVDFDLYALCRFLDAVREEVPGFAFVLERRADGSLRAIAHPDPHALLHATTAEDGTETHELAQSADQMGDPRVRAFLAALTSDASSAAAGGTSSTLEVDQQGEGFFGGYRVLGGAGSPAWSIGMMIPRAEIMEAVERNNSQTLWIALVSFVVASLLSLFVATRISRPLARIAAQCEEIGSFQLDAPSLGRSPIAELDRLMVATDEMKASLRSFEKYVPARLVRKMFAEGVEAELGGSSRRLTVLFSHVADFTRLQAASSAEALVTQLGEYFAEVTAVIERSQGTLDKYMGDAVMAFWGAPEALAAHPLWACRAALGAVDRVADLNRRWAASERPVFRACIGLNTGDLVVGNMGSTKRLSYTVIGDAVNLAARLEGLNHVYGTRILLGEDTYAAVASDVVARRIDRVAVKGRTQGVEIYELLALADGAPPEAVALVQAFEAALAAYFDRRWREAREAFAAILAAWPQDGPSRVLGERCRAYEENPPPDDWDGVHVMTRK